MCADANTLTLMWLSTKNQPNNARSPHYFMPTAKPPIELYCLICDTRFTVQPYRAKTAKFCSAKCRQRGNGILNREKISNTLRLRGQGKTYIKFLGRHLHRRVAEQKLGRPLAPNEIVHHINGNKRDNCPENLEITTQSKHVEKHRTFMLAQRLIKAGY